MFCVCMLDARSDVGSRRLLRRDSAGGKRAQRMLCGDRQGQDVIRVYASHIVDPSLIRGEGLVAKMSGRDETKCIIGAHRGRTTLVTNWLGLCISLIGNRDIRSGPKG